MINKVEECKVKNGLLMSAPFDEAKLKNDLQINLFKLGYQCNLKELKYVIKDGVLYLEGLAHEEIKSNATSLIF